MEWNTFLDRFRSELGPLFGEGEAASLARIVWEDSFGLKPGIGNLNDLQQRQLKNILHRLRQQEPVQYILGKTQFFGLPFKVNPSVLIPRQETEELVAWILDDIKDRRGIRILDIGTGSGCISIVLKKRLPDAEVHALDVSSEALAVARDNANLNQVAIAFHEADILDEKSWMPFPLFDVIVSNPPYIVEEEREWMAPQVLAHEPALALFTGNDDPLRFIKAISKFATKKLIPGGLLYFELNEFHAEASNAEVRAQGFKNVVLRKDLNGKLRMLRATRF